MVNGLRIFFKIKMSKKILHIIFYVFAIIGFIAMLHHIKGIFYPTILSPSWRHCIFVFINIISIYGVIKRPKWFIWFVILLTVQQWYSHGGYALHIWQTESKIHWISIADIILLPLLVTLLIFERKKNIKICPTSSQ
jgi:hypothetical protein